MGARAHAPVPHRAHAATICRTGAARRHRCAAARAPRRLGLSRAAWPAARSRSPARILAAADAYQAMREPRPHREARSADEAARQLRAEARSGRIDGDAVEAVLDAAGHRARRRPEGPAGLTAREVEVLRLLARGLSTKQIAERLAMSPKTAGNHIEHIYTKIDANEPRDGQPVRRAARPASAMPTD